MMRWRAYIAYAQYVLRHKWFVFLACARIGGVPVWRWAGHDWTKFLPAEWGPYVRQFFSPDGSRRQVRDASGAYDPNAQSEAFRYAWLSHQRSRHHWQAWISIGDGGSLTAMQMPEAYIREMVADWVGAGAAQGTPDAPGWYARNKNAMILHPATRVRLEEILGVETGEVER